MQNQSDIAAQEAREAAERQFIGDILADDNSDYGVESPRNVNEKVVGQSAKTPQLKEEEKKSPAKTFVNSSERSEPQDSPWLRLA